jgi:branched-chain amino acid aminotransferase
VLIDGVRVPPEGAVVSVYDRGFLYGDSVFEVVRTYGGKPFGLDEHVARLHTSAAKLGIVPPWTERQLIDELARAVSESGFGESYLRIVVTRGTGELGLDPDLATEPRRVVIVHPLTLPPVKVYRDGIAVLVVDAPRATDGTAAAGAKASNYLANLLALREAKARGAYEPLFVESKRGSAGAREVLEGGTSNVFVVRGDVLVTPDVGRILAGITRKHVIECVKDVSLRVSIEPLPLDALLAAEEVFITSTVREIVPVVRVVDGEVTHAIGDGRPGERVRAIHRAFRRHVGAPDRPMPWEDSPGASV